MHVLCGDEAERYALFDTMKLQFEGARNDQFTPKCFELNFELGTYAPPIGCLL